MKAKDYFKELQQLENQIQSKKFMAQTYRNLAEGVRSPLYSDMPKSPNRQAEPMADALMKALSLEDEVSQLEKEFMMKQAHLMDLILQLDKNQQVILIKRYFEKKAWGQIMTTMYYSKSGIYKLHNQALEALTDILSKSRLE